MGPRPRFGLSFRRYLILVAACTPTIILAVIGFKMPE